MSEPAGIILPYAGSTAPEGYLMCDGSAVSRSTYASLFTAIGTTYGAGDGSTTFNVPDLAGRVVIGVSGSHALGSTGGEATHTLLSSELGVHSHEVPQHGHGNDIAAKTPAFSHSLTQPAFSYTNVNGTNGCTSGSSGTVRQGTVTKTAGNSTNAAVAKHAATACTMGGGVIASDVLTTSAAGTTGAHNNMQPYAVTNYIICTGE